MKKIAGIPILIAGLLLAFAVSSCTTGNRQGDSVPALMSSAGSQDGQPPANSFKDAKAQSDKPVAVPGAYPREGGVPIKIHFFDGGSYSPNGEIVKWEWNFADQEEGAGGWHNYTATRGDAWHTYTRPGKVMALLRVTDEIHKTDIGAVEITLRDWFNANPVAVANATPTFGTAPLTVSFNATGSYDPDGTIVKYEWDFGNGVFQDFTDTGGTATHTYASGGLYTAILRVTDDDGASSTASKELTVNWAPVAVASADPTSGDVPLTVTFGAEGSSDPDGVIVKYEWDFGEGGGYEDFTSSQGAATHIYATAGNYTATLRVTDDWGATGTDDVGVTPGEWHIITADSAGSVGYQNSLAVINGNPAISYLDATNSDLRYARATDADGTSWNKSTVDSAGSVGGYTSLAVVNGNPAISYSDLGKGHLKYARAIDADGTSWITYTVDSDYWVGYYTSLAVVNGNPAISYLDLNNYDLKYARAADADGTSWNTYTVDSAGLVGWHTSLCVVNGNPAISYMDYANGDLKYARATDADGTSWNTYTVDSAGSVGGFTSLAVVNGNPAISYSDASNRDLKYARATDADGTSWNTYTVDTGGTVGDHTSLAVVNGNPAISYGDQTNGDLKYARATDANGTSWNTYTLDSAGDVGWYTSLCVVNGNPAISYYDSTNSNLKFAIYY